MDHLEAINGGFAERYLLCELDSAQRDQFEEHFFDCPLCADDVEAGATFMDNARSILRAREAAETRPAYLGFGLPFQTAALAATCLTVLVAYQNIVTIPQMRLGGAQNRVAEVVASVSLIGMGSRAESRAVTLPARQDALLELEIPGDAGFTGYTFRLLAANGNVKANVRISADRAKDVVKVSVPGTDLERGTYQIVISGKKPGQSDVELSRYPAFVQ